MSSEWTVDKAVTDIRAYQLCGRFVTVAVPLALVALTTAWLFLGAPVRTAVLWFSVSLLAASLVIWAMAVLRDGGRRRGETYGWAVRAASASPGSGDGTVPETQRLDAISRPSVGLIGYAPFGLERLTFDIDLYYSLVDSSL